MSQSMQRIIRRIAAVVMLLSLGRNVVIAQNRTDDTTRSQFVSIVALLAQPATGQARRVSVAGYLVLDFEGEALYLHKEDYENGLTNNAIRVALTEQQKKQYKGYDKRYVLIDSFFIRQKNSSDFYVGALYDIRKISDAK
jgi:hypothetical protein